MLMDLGSSDGVLVCYQKIYSLVRLARKREIMKYTTVKISEIRQHPTMRLDAQYWLARVNNLKLKKKKKIKKAPSRKQQA